MNIYIRAISVDIFTYIYLLNAPFSHGKNYGAPEKVDRLSITILVDN